jgi:hypothetical protein
MRAEVKLQQYRSALEKYNKAFERGVPPVHYPLRTDYGIVRPEEIFVAERIEKMFPKPDPKNLPPAPLYIVREFTDQDLMPFGRHVGKPMSEVPPAYLHFLWKSGMKNDMRSSVADYIRRNLERYKKRYKSSDW